MNLFENILYNLYCFIFNNNFYVNNFKSSNDINHSFLQRNLHLFCFVEKLDELQRSKVS